MSEVMAEPYAYEDFADSCGDAFVLEDGLALTLEECSLLPTRTPSGGSAFSLTFVAATAQMLPQGLYRLTHERLGVREIFLVPVGKDARGFQYQAIFN